MGLLPIVEKALGLFSLLSVTALTISFILYKMRSSKNKPYNRTSNAPYLVQPGYSPAFQAAYYPSAEKPAAPRMAAAAEMQDSAERRLVSERTDNTERSVPERRNVSERRPMQEKKASAKPVSKFQILHSTEDGEIKAYHLPTRNY